MAGWACRRETPAIAERPHMRNGAGMEMVELATGGFVSVYETTQEQFVEVMGYNPSWHASGSLPVENLCASEAEEFCTRLSETETMAGRCSPGVVYRLPTRAEWLEYSAGASLDGSVTPRGWRGDSLTGPKRVGMGERSTVGVYDSIGNVSEFSADLFPSGTGGRILLGASWNTRRRGRLSRSDVHGTIEAEARAGTVGFRCVLAPPIGAGGGLSRETALHREAARGQARAVRSLIAEGADPRVLNRWGQTPLHRAAVFGHVEAVRELLAAGANLDREERLGRSAVHMAALGGRDEALATLLSAGGSFTGRDVFGDSPLHLAARSGNVVAVRRLLRAGADANATNNQGLTPMHWAAQRGSVSMAKSLIAAGADKEIRLDVLLLAQESGHKEIVAYLEELIRRGNQGAVGRHGIE